MKGVELLYLLADCHGRGVNVVTSKEPKQIS